MNNPDKNSLSKSILCVWFPNWPIQRLVVAANELRRTQIILYRNQPGRGQMVTAVSPAARLSGAKVGMPLSEARSLAGHNPQFNGYHIFEHNPSADLRTLQQLAIDCQRFSPLAGLEEGAEPSSILLDIGGLTHLFGGDDGLRSHVHRHFHSRGYLVSTAIAPTIGQAWGLARGRTGLGVAENSVCPDSEPESAWTGSRPTGFDLLPVKALRLQDATVDTLQQLGVTRVFQIRHLPRAGLQSRFGNEITWRLDQADGLIDEVIDAICPPADYVTETFLDYPVNDRETIQVILSRLAGQLCDEMRGNGRGGLVWEFKLGGDELQHPPCQLTVRLFQPAVSLDQLMPLVEMQMEDLFSGKQEKRPRRNRRKQLAVPVQEIRVSVRNCVRLAERQRQLFDENPRLDKQALAHLINRLSSRLGPENVLRPVLQSGVQAEDACCLESLVGKAGPPGKAGPSGKANRRQPRHGTTLSPLQRPLILHPQPVEMSAISLDGTRYHSSGIPSMFVCHNQRLRVTRRWGPERIETAWWRGPTVRRDYWRIETATGRWLWVYRNLQNRHWYLHGEF